MRQNIPHRRNIVIMGSQISESTGMKFHIISAQDLGIFFLRVEPGGDDPALRPLLEEYISHAIGSANVVEFAFEVNNPNLDEFIKPVINQNYPRPEYNAEHIMVNFDKTLDEMKESLRTYTRPAFHLLDVAHHPFTPIVYKPEGIYVYFNSSTNKYVIVRKPFPFDYFPNFTLKWSEVNLTDTAIQFMFNQNLSITTSDEKVINAYRKFIESMVIKDVRGMDFYPNESYLERQVWTNKGLVVKSFNENTRRAPPSEQTLPAACLPAQYIIVKPSDDDVLGTSSLEDDCIKMGPIMKS